MSRCATIFAIIALSMGTNAIAETTAPKFPRKDATVNEIVRWFDDVTAKIEISLDPVLRQIVCRVAYQPFSPDSLIRAMHVSGTKIWSAVDKLSWMGLVNVRVNKGFNLVVPSSDRARDLMRRWAETWCTTDDTCGVRR